MSRSLPEWVENPKDCPIDGCGGKYYTDVGGSAAEPTVEYVTTCGHKLETCSNCGEKFDSRDGDSECYTGATDGSRFDGYQGQWVSYWLCPDCNAVETVIQTIPSWILEQGEAKKVPGYSDGGEE